MSSPKISIITVVYNGASLVEATVKSVLEQTYPNIEYILIDGKSTDNTLAIINKYKDDISTIISEKDQGIYDAMNKGLSFATGDYVLFLNAGDLLYDHNTIQKIFEIAPYADVYYGNTAVIDEQGNLIGDRRLTPPKHLTWNDLKYGMCVSHQSFVPKRSLCPAYDLSYNISSDIDWVIKVLKNAQYIANTDFYISKFLKGGTSKQRQKLALWERFKIIAKHFGIVRTILSHIVILFRYPIHFFTKKTMT